MHSDSHYFIWVTNNRDGVIDMQMSTVRACKDSVGSQTSHEIKSSKPANWIVVLAHCCSLQS